jgi:hypothetical protein
MSFYSDASLALIPSGYKNGKVYSALPTDGSGDLSFTRASNATRVASNGLIEKVRTNVLLQSNTFSAWTASNATVTSGQAGYDGTNTAWLIKGDTTTNRHNVFRSNSLVGEQTLSIYAKAGGHSFLQIAMATTADQYANFDLSTGTIGNAGSDFFNAQITSVGNGWYRISALTLSGGNIYISLVSSNTAGWLESWAMPNNTDGVLIMNGQLEAGVLTEFIGNTTSAAVSVGPVSGLPRLDYLNSTCPRLLLEPQRTNLVTFSEQFNNASWTPTDASITANAAIAPDGTMSADKLVENSANQAHYVQSTSGTYTADTYSMSVFAKASERNILQLLFNGSANVNAFANFDLTNGVVSLVASATASIEDYGNGWYRCTINAALSAATVPLAYCVIVNSLTATRAAAYLGNGTSGLFVWGMQSELGAYATSYIPTLGTSVTRVADAAYKSGISSLIGQTEGTIFAEINFDLGVTASGDSRIQLTDGTTSNWIFIGLPDGAASNLIRMYVNAPSGSMSAYSVNPLVNGVNKIAYGYKSGSFVLYVNGVQAAASSTTLTMATCSRIDLQGAVPTAAATERINYKQVLLFKTRLTNAQLAELTTL